MEKIYTENVLIRYLYKEADFFEKMEVEHALENDQNVRSFYNKLIKAFNILPKVKFVPSQKTVDQILFASREAALQA